MAAYRIVVAEHARPIKGKFIQKLGNYNPHKKETTLNKEAVLFWLEKGALPSERMAKILAGEKIEHQSIKVKTHPPKPAKKKKTTEEKKVATEKKEEPKAEELKEPAEEEVKDDLSREVLTKCDSQSVDSETKQNQEK